MIISQLFTTRATIFFIFNNYIQFLEVQVSRVLVSFWKKRLTPRSTKQLMSTKYNVTFQNRNNWLYELKKFPITYTDFQHPVDKLSFQRFL